MVHAVLAQARLVVPLLSIPNHMLLNAGGPATLLPEPQWMQVLARLADLLAPQHSDRLIYQLQTVRQPVCSDFDLLFRDMNIYHHIYIISP